MTLRLPTSILSFASDIRKLVDIFKKTSRYMKNNKTEASHVDLENGVVHGILKQVRNHNDMHQNANDPRLVPVWCCDVLPIQTKDIISLIRENVTPFDPISLSHMKRFKKTEKNEGSHKGTFILTIIGSDLFLKSKDEVINLLHENVTTINASELNVYKLMVPLCAPQTKELAIEWSAKYWPTSWKGNPNHQVLLSADFVVSKETKIVNMLLDLLNERLRDNEKAVSNVSIIAKEIPGSKEHEIICIAYDNRLLHPLKHSIMEAIEEVARKERNNRQNPFKSVEDENAYLCQDLLVYTIQEPCTMCSMALVHSRIRRVVFLKCHPKGALSTNYQMGDRDDLNWSYETWKWIGQKELNRLKNMLEAARNIEAITKDDKHEF